MNHKGQWYHTFSSNSKKKRMCVYKKKLKKNFEYVKKKKL